MHSWRRTIVALALAPWLVLSPVVPTEHVHEADEHHAAALVHRHPEAHEHAHHDDGGVAELEIDHDESQVVWLDDVSLQPATHQVTVVFAVAGAGFAALPAPRNWVPVSPMDTAPAHGPPRASTSPRSPPSFPLA